MRSSRRDPHPLAVANHLRRRVAAAGLHDPPDDQRPPRIAVLEQQRHLGADHRHSRARRGCAPESPSPADCREKPRAARPRRSPSDPDHHAFDPLPHRHHRPPSVLVDLARPLHRDLAGAFTVILPVSSTVMSLPFDRDRAVLLHRDRGRSAFDDDRSSPPRSYRFSPTLKRRPCRPGSGSPWRSSARAGRSTSVKSSSPILAVLVLLISEFCPPPILIPWSARDLHALPRPDLPAVGGPDVMALRRPHRYAPRRPMVLV